MPLYIVKWISPFLILMASVYFCSQVCLTVHRTLLSFFSCWFDRFSFFDLVWCCDSLIKDISIFIVICKSMWPVKWQIVLQCTLYLFMYYLIQYIFLTTNQKNLTGAVTPVLYFNGLFNQNRMESWFKVSCKYLLHCIDKLIFELYLNVKPTSFFIWFEYPAWKINFCIWLQRVTCISDQKAFTY